MNPKGWLAAICLVGGIPLAAYGLAHGGALFTLAGLALVLAFWYLAWQWFAKSGKPQTPIKPAANAAWSMKEQPIAGAGTSPPSAPTPSPSPASGGGEQDGAAGRRGDA
jgi:hypothetical protein